jgi:hypothetical protein
MLNDDRLRAIAQAMLATKGGSVDQIIQVDRDYQVRSTIIAVSEFDYRRARQVRERLLDEGELLAVICLGGIVASTMDESGIGAVVEYFADGSGEPDRLGEFHTLAYPRGDVVWHDQDSPTTEGSRDMYAEQFLGLDLEEAITLHD